MLTDTRIILQHGNHDVLAEGQTVHWNDGTALRLHQVCLRTSHGPIMATRLRCLITEDHHALVFDLVDVAPVLNDELRTSLPRDVPGVVLYTMRDKYAGADAFTERVQQVFQAGWFTAREPEEAACPA